MSNRTRTTPQPTAIALLGHNATLSVLEYSAILLASVKKNLAGTEESTQVRKAIGDVLAEELTDLLSQNTTGAELFMKHAGATDKEVEEFKEQSDELFQHLIRIQ